MQLPLLFLILLCGAGPLACRNYSPVERHFLRVPALSAAEISGIDRGKWLKRLRREPGMMVTAREQHYMELRMEALPPGVQAPPGEIRFFPEGTDQRSGMVALHWREPAGEPAASARLHLLKSQGGRYLPQPLTRWLPDDPRIDRFSLSAEPGAVVCYRRSPGPAGPAGPVWRKAVVLRWKAGRWEPSGT